MSLAAMLVHQVLELLTKLGLAAQQRRRRDFPGVCTFAGGGVQGEVNNELIPVRFFDPAQSVGTGRHSNNLHKVAQRKVPLVDILDALLQHFERAQLSLPARLEEGERRVQAVKLLQQTRVAERQVHSLIRRPWHGHSEVRTRADRIAGACATPGAEP
jgi:hypothetical protein